jgi:hypothetical protein
MISNNYLKLSAKRDGKAVDWFFFFAAGDSKSALADAMRAQEFFPRTRGAESPPRLSVWRAEPGLIVNPVGWTEPERAERDEAAE